MAAGATTTATRIQPLGDRVLVKPLPGDEVSKGGILLPDTAKEKPQQGQILAVGPGRWDESGKRVPLDLKEGDRILYAKYSGHEFKRDGEELLLLSERDVLAIVEE